MQVILLNRLRNVNDVKLVAQRIQIVSGQITKSQIEAGKLTALFANRFLAFDREAAAACALLVRRAMARGFAIGVADDQIAAIATVHGFTVATHEAPPFLAAGVPVIDPWGK